MVEIPFTHLMWLNSITITISAWCEDCRQSGEVEIAVSIGEQRLLAKKERQERGNDPDRPIWAEISSSAAE